MLDIPKNIGLFELSGAKKSELLKVVLKRRTFLFPRVGLLHKEGAYITCAVVFNISTGIPVKFFSVETG
jgi:hypothetical protein